VGVRVSRSRSEVGGRGVGHLGEELLVGGWLAGEAGGGLNAQAGDREARAAARGVGEAEVQLMIGHNHLAGRRRELPGLGGRSRNAPPPARAPGREGVAGRGSEKAVRKFAARSATDVARVARALVCNACVPVGWIRGYTADSARNARGGVCSLLPPRQAGTS